MLPTFGQTDPLEWLLTVALPSAAGVVVLAVGWAFRGWHVTNAARLEHLMAEVQRRDKLLDRAHDGADNLQAIVADQQRTIDRLTAA